MVSIDDSGLKETGKLQWTAAVGIDRVFNANDALNLSVNRDAVQDGEHKAPEIIVFLIPFLEEKIPLVSPIVI